MTNGSRSPAVRYEIERAWRQVRNGAAAARTDDGQLGVRLSLQSGNLIEARSDLVEDEKRDCRGNANVADESPHRVE